MVSIKNETTSYDAAIVDAGIGHVNVVILSSMISPEAIEIPYTTPKWGDVIYCIMARNDGKKDKTISCALLITEVYYEQNLIGSFVLEYSGNKNENLALKTLLTQVLEMVQRRGYGNLLTLTLYSQNRTGNGYTIVPKKFIYNSLKVKKKYGTVICSICF